MKTKPAFVQFIEETLTPIKARCKSMFGGWGVYTQDHMIGLIAEDVLYLKTDTENIGMFKNANLEPFTYQTAHKSISMSYYRASEDMLEDWEALQPWIMGAVAAANRQVKKKVKA